MNKKQGFLLFSIICLSSLLGLFYVKNFQIETDILSVLNKDLAHTGFFRALELHEKRAAGQLILGLVDLEEVQNNTILREMKQHSAFVDMGHEEVERTYQDIYKLYFLKMPYLLTAQQIKLIERGHSEEIKQQALKKIYSPFVSETLFLEKDPLLLNLDFFRSDLNPAKLIPVGDFLKRNLQDKNFFITGKIREMNEELAYHYLLGLKAKYGDEKILFSALPFHNIEARKLALAESNLFSVISMVLILFIFRIYFKSFRHLFISFALISFIFIVSLTVTTLIWGPIHIISLLFCVSIQGIVADYFIHFFIKEQDENIENANAAYLSVKRPLFWSFCSTLFGLALFYFSPLSILKQFSMLSVVTLLCAYLCVKYVLPQFFVHYPMARSEKHHYAQRFVSWLPSNLYLVVFFICLLVAMNTWLLNQKGLFSDIRTFSTPNAKLALDEEKIKSLLGFNVRKETIVVRHKTLDALVNELEILEQALEVNNVKFKRVSQYLLTTKKQEKSWQAFQKLKPTIEQLAKQLGLHYFFNHPNQMVDFQREILPLGENTFLDSWIGTIDQHLYIALDIFISDTNNFDIESLKSKNVMPINKVSLINAKLVKFSQSIIQVMTLSVGLFFLFIYFKYGIYRAFYILAPSLLALGLTLLIVFLKANQVNIFYLLGAVLILTLGIDYSFYYFFSKQSEFAVSKSVTLSMLTTLCSFGMLALSSTHAVSSFGLTVMIGVLLCWVFTPMSLKGRDHV